MLRHIMIGCGGGTSGTCSQRNKIGVKGILMACRLSVVYSPLLLLLFVGARNGIGFIVFPGKKESRHNSLRQ